MGGSVGIMEKKMETTIWVVVKMMVPLLDPYYNTAPDI